MRLGALLLASQFLCPVASGQSVPVAEQRKRRRAEAAADLFIKRFHQTLDFGVAFDEFAVPDAIHRLRKGDELKGLGLTEDLDKQVDDQTAANFYKVSMNFIYLMNIYSASVEGGSGNPETDPLPKDMQEVVERSPQLKHIFSDTVEDFPKVASLEELRRYMSDLNRMAALYKKHLPRNVFASETYKRNIKALEKERGHQFEIYKGDDYFGIDKKVEVYGVCRDLFCFRFIEEKGKFKILGVILGN